MSETDVKLAITKALEAAGYIVTRTAASGYRGRMQGAKKGTADVHVTGLFGRAVWLEVKKDDSEKPTVEQVAFILAVRKRGAYADCVCTPAEAISAVKKASVCGISDGMFRWGLFGSYTTPDPEKPVSVKKGTAPVAVFECM